MKSVGVGKLWLGKLVDITCQVPFQKVYLEGFFLSRDSFEAMTMSLSGVQDAFRRKSCSMVLKLRSNTEEQANRHFKENASNPLEHAKTICTWYFFSTRVCKPNAFLPLWSTHMVRMRQNSGHIVMCDARIVHDFWNLHTEYIFLDYYGFSVQLS